MMFTSRFTLVLLAAVGIAPVCVAQTPADRAEGPLLRSGDRVAMLGGTFVERMQADGSFEAELHCRRPDWKLRLRNLGWSGDDVHGIARKRFDGPADGFARMLRDVEGADPTVVLVAYGFSEASDGEKAMAQFGPGLTKLVNELSKEGRRVILLTPVATPGYRVEGYRERIERCGETIRQVGLDAGAAVLPIGWQPSPGELTEDGLLPNDQGYASIARSLADSLVGGQPCAGDTSALKQRVVDKNQLFFHRYRPQNETYLFLFRKHEQGNNAVEIPQFDPLIRASDESIWELAATASAG